MSQIIASVKSSVYTASTGYSVGLGAAVLLQQGVKFWSKSQNYPALQALVSSPNFLEKAALCVAVQHYVEPLLNKYFPEINKYVLNPKGKGQPQHVKGKGQPQRVQDSQRPLLELLAARLGRIYVSPISAWALGVLAATTLNTNSRILTCVKYTLWAASAITLSEHLENATGSEYGLYAGAKKLRIA